MGAFINLDDSPMFQKQISGIEQQTDELKDRCHRLYKGCKKYMETLGEACNGDTSFADSLEAFGGGQDDPVSVSIGGPVMSKFIAAFRELASYKELLRSQVEHVLIDRLSQFLSVDVQDAKVSRQRFDKAIHAYDQARDKCSSLKKSTRDDVVADLEEDLHNSKSAFERSRFNLVSSLMNIEAKKKYEFLESLSAIMDAHLRFFKLGYELLSQLEPFIHQVLTYAQQSKELANIEQDNLAKRIQEFRTQTELDQLRASSNVEVSTSAVHINGVGMSSYKNIEAIMQSTAKGEIQTIKQGYLLKRSSSLRVDWKRRFFVLDGHGTLYYYTNKGTKAAGSTSVHSFSSMEHNHRVFGRFRPRHHRSSSVGEENLGCRIVDLRTSTIKIDAEDTDLRLCFRIISPAKTYTLQAENEVDRIDWMNKITGVIASILNSHLRQLDPGRIDMENNNASGAVSFDVRSIHNHQNLRDDKKVNEFPSVSLALREIPGNDICVECGAPEPDWASLNLGILMCIECSGVHRNLGVHISKVRSITLDVKVWEPTIMDLFQILGNAYCNSIWEELLLLDNNRTNESNAFLSVTKPSPKDAIHQKEKYIHAKYVEKLLVNKAANLSSIPSQAAYIWEAVKTNNLREVYRLIVTSSENIINTTYDEVFDVNLYHHVDEEDPQIGFHAVQKKQNDPVVCQKIKDSAKPENCLQGCSLLHLACHRGNPVMLELLLQFGADMNRCDYHGRTPLHHCIAKRNNQLAKFLLKRGARPSIKDGGGLSVLERVMEMGAITDEELFLLLAECK
ncbi:ADP-ribosylation factor GTPase-activating protein AGD4-like isoform X1 [Camellia sinensis]|uniref:ADP-ribosylation factor GTPase-activating protein AGD4-like isoform X1 n=1 Tax=Camellia sinensis TaxID=4442 RepID=UPI00103642D5|nr:ADP-ribosylation factor GTPase-activating protein AGD4-like isoform X1 [Camellia sinensis]XP_028096437.1 ADP-ribosylation factor GTPase-activating protein AGD4-like isoform X1 [Camellia sinensis]XP_028096440.1 ADP-ribosylation factor GTPase-activating protein AGD4-like isoform X1 [Camellia sinensis]